MGVISFVRFFSTFFLLGGNSFLVELSFLRTLYRELSFSFIFDYISLMFFSAISLISCVIFLYRKFYFHRNLGSPNFYHSRYAYLLGLFVLSIFFLVFSGSFMVVIIGWDGLGLVSFLLVIFYSNAGSLNAGLITIFSNRIGDCLFILRFLMMFGGG